MRVDCLMGTYGRYTFVCEALTCFLQQTASEDATLLIYNQHPVPLRFDHPRVRVVNEVMDNADMRRIKARMVELSDPAAEFLHWWDDDDLIMPWHLEDCLAHVGDHLAWKPARSWLWFHRGRIELQANNFEATCIYRSSAVRAAPLDTHPNYGDHPIYMQLSQRGLVATTEMGELSSYLYRWATGIPHLSHFVEATPDAHPANFEKLREGLLDTGEGKPLHAVDLTSHWEAFLADIEPQVSEAGYDEICARLAIADARSNRGTGSGT